MKRLRRSRNQRMLGGVLGGIAEYFDIDVTLVRLGYVILSILSAAFPGAILYLIAIFVIPNEY